MLSKNPGLTRWNARVILESTADKIGNYTYASDSNHPNGTWNNEVGYGRVNAYNAVSSACTPTVLDDSFWYYFNFQHHGNPDYVVGCKIIIPQLPIGNKGSAGVFLNHKLEIKASESTEIQGDFEVPLGSELLIH